LLRDVRLTRFGQSFRPVWELQLERIPRLTGRVLLTLFRLRRQLGAQAGRLHPSSAALSLSRALLEPFGWVAPIEASRRSFLDAIHVEEMWHLDWASVSKIRFLAALQRA